MAGKTYTEIYLGDKAPKKKSSVWLNNKDKELYIYDYKDNKYLPVSKAEEDKGPTLPIVNYSSAKGYNYDSFDNMLSIISYSRKYPANVPNRFENWAIIGNTSASVGMLDISPSYQSEANHGFIDVLFSGDKVVKFVYFKDPYKLWTVGSNFIYNSGAAKLSISYSGLFKYYNLNGNSGFELSNSLFNITTNPSSPNTVASIGPNEVSNPYFKVCAYSDSNSNGKVILRNGKDGKEKAVFTHESIVYNVDTTPTLIYFRNLVTTDKLETTKTQLTSEIKESLKTELKESLKSELTSELKELLTSELKEQITAELKESLKKEILEELKAEQ